MSPHQQRQGYAPSTHQGGLYNTDMLPSTSIPVSYPTEQQSSRTVPTIQMPRPPLHPVPASAISYPGPTRPPPPPPAVIQTSTSVEPSSRSKQPALKQVTLPRECLPRFIAIAKLNTKNNKETCGLLLGVDKGNKYVVTTLLVPKQHATSDTCTMDEEELVLQFTEERGLFTLGWIHTHPSQSCAYASVGCTRAVNDSFAGFMSSVDLHTHSGFQRMLPESFAVVCAPSSTPRSAIHSCPDCRAYLLCQLWNFSVDRPTRASNHPGLSCKRGLPSTSRRSYIYGASPPCVSSYQSLTSS